jgi:hypothetical protein
MAFAPKFDLFGYHLNQSSSDQFDFAQRNTYKFLSDNRIYILHRIQNSFSEICFSTITKLSASCSPVDAPEGTAALPKTPLSVITSTQ